ncbi:MAG: hypothetical protein Q7R33_03605, partial [Nitrosarchaeum sp.]|nr:hypothetical protein [Nitrosarchaeum sp.]
YKKIRQYGEAGSINELYIDKNNAKTLEDANWRLMSDDTKRKTDELWSNILGLTHDIFANSVFFGQDGASKFISGTAAERKEILCSLLDSKIYELAEQIAKDKTKELDTSIQTKSIVLNDKIALAEKKEDIQELQKSNVKQIKTIDENIALLQTDIEKNRTKKEQLTVSAANQEKNKERASRLVEQIATANKNKKQITEDLASTNVDLESLIDEGIEKVEALQKLIDTEPTLLEEQLKLETSLKTIATEKLKLPDIKVKLTAQRDTKERLLQEQSEITTRVKALTEKQNKIKKAGAICPIIDEACDKLTDENKEKMTADFEKEKQSFTTKQTQLDKDMTYTRESIVTLDGQLEAISKKIEKEPSVTARLTTVKSDLDQIKLAKEELPKTKLKYRTRVDKLQASIKDFTSRLKKVTEEYDKLKEEQSEIEKTVVTDFASEIAKIDRQIKTLNADITEMSKEKETLVENSGKIKTELGQILNAETDAKKIKIDINKLQDDLRVYTELCFAFGRNGIQKDIINNNVPLLEEKANELLAKFTKNSQSRIRFDLDPITKSGKLKKQGGLDIIIYQSNEQPRPLNMHSGGETIRIVFAILLSLSSLLTKRAGKKSETLIVDERVAALDQEGVNQFIEIVRDISSQYRKILIVSHITELKEAFSHQIEVNKPSKKIGSKVVYKN